MRRAVKRSSNRSRIFARDSCDRRYDRADRAFSSSTMKPVTPSSMTSGTEPRLNAMTGVPHAMASIITSPNGSGQSIGTSSAIAPLRNSGFVLVGDLADVFDIRAVDQRLDLLLEIVLVGLVDLGRDLQRNAALRRDADGAVDALFRRDTAEESEISRLDRLRRQQFFRQAHDGWCAPSPRAAPAGAANWRSKPSAASRNVAKTG